MMDARILIVDDEPDMLEVCRDALARTGAKVEIEGDGQSAARRICTELFDLVILDICMPGIGGMDLMKCIQGPSVILMTGFPSAETVEESVRRSAAGYITKPFTADQFVATVTRALIRRTLAQPHAAAKRADPQEAFDGMIGSSSRMKAVFELIEQVAPTSIDVLILGESGTGKELVARSIHRRSGRACNRFVPVDCGAIPENLLESELFGHEKGAFTGATSSGIGLMEFAHKGVLFLDEICELAAPLQVKLLRALQERQIRRVGGNELIPVDMRVLAATNRNVEQEVRSGRMREDLFYRLNAIEVRMPALRERQDDIPRLFDHYLSRAAGEAGKPGLQAAREVYDHLLSYRWPGNVRELQNVARRAAIVCRDSVVKAKDLPPELNSTPADPRGPMDSFFARRAIQMRDFAKVQFSEALQRCAGDVEAAAASLGLPRGTLYRLLKKHGLKPDSYRRDNHTGGNPVTGL